MVEAIGRSYGMHAFANTADTAGDIRGIARSLSCKSTSTPRAIVPVTGIGNYTVLYLYFYFEMAFETGNRVYNNSLSHLTLLPFQLGYNRINADAGCGNGSYGSHNFIYIYFADTR